MSQIDKILAQYKRAWEGHDTNLLPEIFHADAVYEEKPWKRFNGLSEISLYWDGIGNSQKDVSFLIKDVHECDGRVFVEWFASFYRTDLNRNLTLKGILILDVVEGKIKRLREFYFVLPVDLVDQSG